MSTQEQQEPKVGDISPVVKPGVEKEPMFLIDTTQSMTWANDENGSTTRKDLLGEAMGEIVARLEGEDSQAAAEKAAGEDAGGVMTVTFAGGTATNIGDLSSENWREKWKAIQWGGGTAIMPGWNLLVETYLDEFGDTPAMDRPQMLGLIVTDGEAEDTDEFAAEIAKAASRTHVVIALMGHGREHDRALQVYQGIAASNDHVRVVTFGGQTNPTVIADAVLSLLG